jgi:pimeloyl-ACP methyl ester carboxylesterase
MKNIYVLLSVVVTLLGSVYTSPLPWTNGNYSVETIPFWRNGTALDNYIMTVFSPRIANESSGSNSFPVLFFIGGFGADVPALFYTDVMNSIASHGVIIAGLWKVQFPNYPRMAKDVLDIVETLQTNLVQELRKHNNFALPDFTKSVILGHSSGAHLAVQALINSCSIFKAAVLIDPVDGYDPFGIIKDFVIRPPNPVNFKMPALHIATGYDSASRTWLTPPCAPLNYSNNRFFDAWLGPIWQVNATSYGHASILDGVWNLFADVLCHPGVENNLKPYHSAVSGWITSFLQAVMQEEFDALIYLKDNKTMPVVTDTRINLNGYSENTPAFCERVNFEKVQLTKSLLGKNKQKDS